MRKTKDNKRIGADDGVVVVATGTTTTNKSPKDKNKTKKSATASPPQRSPSLSLLSSTSSSSISSISLHNNHHHQQHHSHELYDSKLRNTLIDNELRSFKNRGFHDGYDDGKKAVIKQAFDSGYKKAFEQNFILSTLKGVASALRTSYNSSSGSSNSNSSSGGGATSGGSSSSSSSNSVNVNISSKHLSILESMKFDGTSDIESIKKDLIKVCRENRLEILAHYVSQIG